MKKKFLKNVLATCSAVFMLGISASVFTSCEGFEPETLPIPENQLQPIRDDGIQEIEEYIRHEDYRQKEQEQITKILKSAKDEFNKATNEEEVNKIILLTKEKLDALKTDLEYQLEEQEENLKTAKLEKKDDINSFFEQLSENDYRQEQWEEILNHIRQATQEIDSMTSIEEVEKFDIAVVQEKIDTIKTDAILVQEELEVDKKHKLNELRNIYEQYCELRYSAKTLSDLDTIYSEAVEKIQNCTTKDEVARIKIMGDESAESQMKALPLAIVGRGNAYFDSLAEALAFNSIEVLSLYDNIRCDVVILENMRIVLDLNGYTLTNTSDHTIINAGTLTIRDTSSQKTGTVDNLTHQKAAIVNQVGGHLTIESGKFTRSLENGQSSKDHGGNSYYVIQNFGAAIIKDGTVCQDGQYSSMIANGWYDGKKNSTKASAELIIENGIFSGGLNTIKNDDYGITTIKNGTFTNFSQAAVFNVNLLTIEGGVIDGTNAIQAIYTRWYNTGYDLGKTIIHENVTIKGKITGVDAYYDIHENNTSISEIFLNISNSQAFVDALKNPTRAMLNIKLLKNISSDIVIPEDMRIVLDLNGYTLTNTSNHTIINAGTLTIRDTSSQKTGTVDNLTHQKAAIVNQVGGHLTIESGKFTRSLENGQSSKDHGGNSYYVIQNFGTAVIKDGMVCQDGQYSSMIANGWYDGKKNSTKASAELIIENGIFSGGLNTIKNDDYGITTIKNGTFTNFSQAAVFNVNLLTIEGGVIDGTNAIQAIYTRWYNTEYDLGKTIIHENVTIKGKITGVDAYYDIHESNTSVLEVSLSMSDGWALVNALKDQKGSRLPAKAQLSIKLLKDIALPKEGYIFNRKNVVLDLNGKALSLAYEEGQTRNNYGTLVIAQSKVTINDSSTTQTGKVINTDTTGGKLTTTNDYNYAIRVGKNADLTINAGYYYSSASSSGAGSSCIYIYNNPRAYSAKVTINGGVFATEKDYNGTYFVLNVDDKNNYKSQFIVNAGTFINYKPGTTNTGSKDVITVKDGASIIEEIREGNTYYIVG